MGLGVLSDNGAYLLSGVSAQVTGTAVVDLRASNGNFMLIISASSNGPSGNASAQHLLQHSHDLTAWTTLELRTASATGTTVGMYTASYSAGAYGYVRGVTPLVYSAAQTGTAILYSFILPGRT